MSTPQGPPPPPPDAGQPEESAPYGYAPPPPGNPPQGYPPQGYGSYTQPMPSVPASAQYGPPQGPIGQIRPTGMIMLLFFVTLGIWAFVYYFQTHEEMKRHTGEGIGGVIAVVICLFVGLVNPFLLSHEVGQLYARRGQEPPVTALTGLWFFPGMFILVGPFIWFIQTNRALNEYWQSQGQTQTTLV
ncbi:MAG TPA: DUF4234 domain-containing protein [Blastococcus sp.]|nr:DUF4234 domain-containing protein [Blastococcus sp.]